MTVIAYANRNSNNINMKEMICAQVAVFIGHTEIIYELFYC